MPQGLIELLYLTGLIIIVSTIMIIPTLIWRYFKGRPLLETNEKKKIDSPAVLYLGFFFSIGMMIEAFIDDKHYLGLCFMMIAIAFLVALIEYKKCKRD